MAEADLLAAQKTEALARIVKLHLKKAGMVVPPYRQIGRRLAAARWAAEQVQAQLFKSAKHTGHRGGFSGSGPTG